MSDIHDTNREQEILDSAVAQGGAYEILRKRLTEQGQQLHVKATELNQHRLAEFGQSQMDIIGRIRIRTENNCQARDIVRVGEWLLFGYNVFLGLKRETHLEDVFSLYRLIDNDGEFDVEAVAYEGTFLNDNRFIQDFTELYTYYKNTQLLQLVERDGKLLASFQIGDRITDVRVFRWSISSDKQRIEYIDNRGERDIALPPAYDFDWIKTQREDTVNGRFPHINILDTVFVETTGGDLTVKCENNTEDGLGIYREAVLDKNQSLDDAQIEYAQTGSLILLKVLPYREENWRYLVYNTLTQSVQRIDAIGQACVQLPEDHGIIFPGGYYLQNGDYKTFDQPMEGMYFRRLRRSPNGEDVLYVFYSPTQGRLALFNYNMIERKLATPLVGHGYAMLEDGKMVLFEGEGEEATRVHPMQVWQTPFYSEEFADKQPPRNGFYGRIGNADLVRGISEILHVAKEIEGSQVSIARYEQLSQQPKSLLDLYYWFNDEHCLGIGPLLKEIAQTSELVLDEYEKVESIRQQSAKSMQEAINRQKSLLSLTLPDSWTDIQQFVDSLNSLNTHHGHLISLREFRYMDLTQLNKMETEITEAQQRVSQATAQFLASDKALQPFKTQLTTFEQQIEKAQNSAQLDVPMNEMAQMSEDLDMLSNLMASLTFEDVTQQTQIIDAISQIYAQLNQSRARLQQKRKSQSSVETVAQFGAQFRLFSQGITNALSLATDPERCEEQLSRLLVQLEELESQFSQHDEFLDDILSKREELLETFEAHKQSLLDDRQRRSQSLLTAANRLLENLQRRTTRLQSQDELNAFFASDPLALKTREIIEKLREINDNVKADDIDARLKSSRDQAIRILRDKTDIFEEGGNVIKLGPRHRFSVNTQELDLTILPKEDKLWLYLTGTDFQEPIDHPELETLRPYWNATLSSESETVYRAEYLAYSIIYAASKRQDGLTLEILKEALSVPEKLEKLVRDFATPRYKEGYEKGIHDHDAIAILKKLLPVGESTDLLRYNPTARAIAAIFWEKIQTNEYPALWPERARTAVNIQQLFHNDDALIDLQAEIEADIRLFLTDNPIKCGSYVPIQAAEYLSFALARTPIELVYSKYAKELVVALQNRLEAAHMWIDFNRSQQNLASRYAQRWALIQNWLQGLCSQADYAHLTPYIPGAIAIIMLDKIASARYSEVDLYFKVNGLLGEHPTIENQTLSLSLDDYFSRMRGQRKTFIPAFNHYLTLRQKIVLEERQRLKLDEFKAKPLSSFVRNKLINDVYLPIIGDNMAKQIGALGEGKRTDLMGLLLMISPPGYGKTTLMEYVADRLGLIFMKINGPALGHNVLSLDPEQAPNATAKQELEKLNLALEMGNNVMLYVDDIQHTHPEFLQKFISLCDGTRRIEGVWKGKTRTYDMRGKKFCVVMAGNPYTESGELFKIPDMLANRADIYNLGEVLGGMDDAFALSYIENSLTSNSVLAPLALRDLNDLYLFVDKAMGKSVSTNSLSYPYSDAEINEIVMVLKHLITLRDVILKVNQQYIASAAQSDKYRTEPAFRLQGSYRNMNKLSEKVSAVMNEKEIERLLDDHYLGEAQLLTTGAEENLLKLAEIRGTLTEQDAIRWQQIKKDFMRNKALGGDNADIGDRVVSQLANLVESVQSLR
ncbi:TPA: DNA repair ATPase [Proteus mirabilis]|nr:DNA repair ATPase [Proteus mirabilis]HEK0558875.1 DNA repair ATPase [Proteus mirabilis]HEK1956738.1 DNA repair ATPase [Proteus mirabilis]HEK3021597.1 DNA repair ATPase [Proteus mirabilis]HEK3260479.1 DNA repair ATPase [Proteus mirabilis]